MNRYPTRNQSFSPRYLSFDELQPDIRVMIALPGAPFPSMSTEMSIPCIQNCAVPALSMIGCFAHLELPFLKRMVTCMKGGIRYVLSLAGDNGDPKEDCSQP